MASAIFFLDTKGQSILARDYRGEISLSQIPEKFTELVINASDADVKPVFAADGLSYCWIRKNDIYTLAVTRGDTNAVMTMAFLKKLVDLFTAYYNKFEEETIRDNFVVTYELLDEMMDNGLPQLTEPKVLKNFVTNAAKQASVMTASTPSSIATTVPWRAEGIKHKKNEIFVDVIERIDALVGANSRILQSEIHGTLKTKSFLSGMPELKLGLNDKLMNEIVPKGAANRGNFVELRNVRFHHCVRLNKFESDRTISFVPPDGEFELMNYRLPNNPTSSGSLDDEIKLPFWVECTLDPCTMNPNSTKAAYLIKLRSTFKPRTIASHVEVHIPAPRDASNPIFKASSGHAKYHPDKQCVIWSLQRFQGQREQLMTAQLSRPTVTGAEPDFFYKRPIEMRFEIPFFTLSGITVRHLRIFEPSGYQALPWVRYITQNGEYQIRMS